MKLSKKTRKAENTKNGPLKVIGGVLLALIVLAAVGVFGGGTKKSVTAVDEDDLVTPSVR